jgi:hypothetical protein
LRRHWSLDRPAAVTLIVAFLPLVVFSLLSRFLPHGYIGVAGLVAAAVAGHTTRRLPETLLGLVVPVAIIVYMLKFSKSYPDRVTHEQAQAPTARPGG